VPPFGQEARAVGFAQQIAGVLEADGQNLPALGVVDAPVLPDIGDHTSQLVLLPVGFRLVVSRRRNGDRSSRRRVGQPGSIRMRSAGEMEMFRFDHGAITLDQRPLHEVFQFTDVARKIVFLQRSQVRRTHGGVRDAHFRGEQAQKVSHQHRDVFLPVAQGRHMNCEPREPKIEVLAEPTRGHRCFEIRVGAGEQPHLHLLRRRGAHRNELTVFEHPQQLDLQPQRHFADLIDKQGPVVRLLEIPLVIGGGTAERTLAVTEDGRLRQLVRNGAAVHRHERVARQLAPIMDDAGDQFLARPALAGDQDAGPGKLLQPADVRHDVLKRRTATDESRQPPTFRLALGNDRQFGVSFLQGGLHLVPVVDLGFEERILAPQFLSQPVNANVRGDAHEHLPRLERLGNAIHAPGLETIQNFARAVADADEHDRDVLGLRGGLQLPAGRAPVQLGPRHIEDDQIRLALTGEAKTTRAIHGVQDVVARAFQRFPQGTAVGRGIVDQQDTNLGIAWKPFVHAWQGGKRFPVTGGGVDRSGAGIRLRPDGSGSSGGFMRSGVA
jgi:hypothetical protein